MAAAAPAEDEAGIGTYQKMDYGPVIAETIIAAWPEPNVALKGLAVRLDHDAAMIFDTDLMRWSAATVGGWIDLSVSSHTRRKGKAPPTVEGRELFATAQTPGWARHGVLEDPRADTDGGHLPREWAHWNGFYRYGDRVVLSYQAAGVDLLESPSTMRVGDALVFRRTLLSPGSAEPMVAYVAQAVPDAMPEVREGALHVEGASGRLGFRVETDLPEATVRLGAKNRVEMHLPAHSGPATIDLLIWEEAAEGGPSPEALREAIAQDRIDFAAAVQGGPTRWAESVETSVEIAADEAAYVVDRIDLPFENPWNSWIRPTGFDFFADGERAAVCTWNGDVWIVSGLGGSMDRVTWRRFASGLYYPMGVLVVDGMVHVTERAQLTRLHDLNGDGEADFYENVNNDGLLHPMAHALCLQVDSEGNFYFYKNGNRVPETVREHGALMRVSADGSKREIFATGIRGSNSLGIGPDDMILGADQQGDWVPSTRVDWLRKDRYYGYAKHNPHGYPEGDFEPPICWIPHKIDNSTGAIIYADDDRWGPMSDHWMIGSYGQSTLLALLTETKGDRLQGGVVTFPLEFASGVVRARMNLKDGQLYLLGMKGWQTTGALDGSFERVRYTGLPNRMPIGFGVEPGHVRIDFAEPLDPASVTAENFTVERWQYIYSAKYGSPEMSVVKPDQQGRDPVAVSSARLSPDGRSVFVEIPDLRPVMQQGVTYRLRFADGVAVENSIYHTIHRLSDADTTVARSGIASKPEPIVARDRGAEETDGEEADWSLYAPGREIYENTCTACHQAGGGGLAPSLIESPWAGGSPDALVRIVLQGRLSEGGTMMPFSWLSDDEIASLLSYIRVRWHEVAPISPEQVKTIREATQDRSRPWTIEELKKL